MPDIDVGSNLLDYISNSFLIVIPNVGLTGVFQDATQVEAETQVIKKWTGGSLLAKNLPGKIEVAPVTFSRGALHGDRTLYEKFKRTANMFDERAIIPSNEIYENLDIVQTDRSGAVLTRFALEDCWASKFVSGGWDATANETRVEQITFEVTRWDQDPDLASLNLVNLVTTGNG
jgi:phage tail-like protein